MELILTVSLLVDYLALPLIVAAGTCLTEGGAAAHGNEDVVR